MSDIALQISNDVTLTGELLKMVNSAAFALSSPCHSIGDAVKLVGIRGIKNIPGLIPTSSTWMFAQNVYNLVKYIVKDGVMELNFNDEIVNSILVTHNKEIVHTGAREAMGI